MSNKNITELDIHKDKNQIIVIFTAFLSAGRLFINLQYKQTQNGRKCRTLNVKL